MVLVTVCSLLTVVVMGAPDSICVTKAHTAGRQPVGVRTAPQCRWQRGIGHSAGGQQSASPNPSRQLIACRVRLSPAAAVRSAPDTRATLSRVVGPVMDSAPASIPRPPNTGTAVLR